jgi:S-adenosylmethionine synthetase
MLKAVEAPLMGHPDKVCDLLVESVVDAYLERDPLAKFDIQALGTSGMVMIGGVVDSRADFDVTTLARAAYAKIGYKDEIDIFVNLEKPAVQVVREERRGLASGTAIVYGYATRETRELLPPVVVYANSLARRIDSLRQQDPRFSWLRPDGKVQMAMNGRDIAHITLIAAHDESMDARQVQQLLMEHAVAPVVGDMDSTRVLINPLGPFTVGGFKLNAGVSGRKILSDTYGGLLPHGGSALIGKDPLKPAKAGTLMARFVARELVREGRAGNVLVSAVYTVGLSDPVALTAITGEGEDISAEVAGRFDFRPEAIVERFNLRRPLYAAVANYGLFGRGGVPWEEAV